ncbi:aspartyl/asparaginyl beta-hydroxylase (cupin superfamily) [Bradyrhizobium elkanii]|uniref:hypothetical protein n=1 Tax=Bradyrhizobium elkanii TaxID=29448 RepID=UPI0021682973|nr:hypothetical protein [Bradyrhizobium elkanii]MCS3476271.1 aspartyl/asparaginyl beta-hydroxylase (cupin superfamily) [Bradyrhizobium elkanii]MCS3686658.1 aspartyl/asparaginyl beta-hydroxylase (cupin superfamily) [Bradyrhizobium elkanii]
MNRRLRSAVATREAIEALAPDARAQRAQHLVDRERQQRLEAARSDLKTAQADHEHALARVPETAAALEVARANLSAIKSEIGDAA